MPKTYDVIERCIRFTVEITRIFDALPFSRSTNIFANQIIRSSSSIGANLTEARGSGTKKVFRNFNEVALRSANETIYWLMVTSTITPNDRGLTSALCECRELASIIAAGLIKIGKR